MTEGFMQRLGDVFVCKWKKSANTYKNRVWISQICPVGRQKGHLADIYICLIGSCLRARGMSSQFQVVAA